MIVHHAPLLFVLPTYKDDCFCSNAVYMHIVCGKHGRYKAKLGNLHHAQCQWRIVSNIRQCWKFHRVETEGYIPMIC